MKRAVGCGMWALMLSLTLPGQVNPGAAVQQDFEQRVAEYVKLHKKSEAALPKLKPTDAPEVIARHEHELARSIIKARPQARQGDLFTPSTTAEFRRLIGITMRGPEAARLKDSLKSAEPVQLSLRVNDTYPAGAPLQSTPPTLLQNLPRLPPELDYRVVSHALVLRDVGANLVVDFIPAAIP